MTETTAPISEAAGAAPPLSVGQRIAAIFARPAHAWGGLETRAQWWIPLLIVLAFASVSAAFLHQRAVLPMIRDAWDERVAAGEMSAESAAQAEQFMAGPMGIAFTVIQQAIVLLAMTLLLGLAISFAVGFLMGGKLRYRLALEVAAWSSLVSLPGQALVFVLAWFRESFQGVHIGFGAFLPEADPPSKLLTGLGVFLDAIGPFALWTLAVMILGASALSGKPRQAVAWTLGTVYVVLWLFFAGIAAVVTPGA